MTTYKVKVYPSGHESWYLEGTNTYHRVGGPAIVGNHGYRVFYQYGKYHNEDGPAIVDRRRGITEWWLDGKKYHNQMLWLLELSDRRLAKAFGLPKELQGKEQDALAFAMMQPPVFVNTDEWRIQPKCEFLPLLLNWGDIRVQANAFWAGWNYGGPTPKVEVTMATLESLLGHKVKIVKEK